MITMPACAKYEIIPIDNEKSDCAYIFSILQDAAHWLMDQDNLERSEAHWFARQEQLQRDAEEAARQEKINRKKLLEKYHLQAVPSSAQTHVPMQSRQGTKSKVQITSTACTVIVHCITRRSILFCQAVAVRLQCQLLSCNLLLHCCRTMCSMMIIKMAGSADLVCVDASESSPLQRRRGRYCKRGEVCCGESRTRLGWR